MVYTAVRSWLCLVSFEINNYGNDYDFWNLHWLKDEKTDIGILLSSFSISTERPTLRILHSLHLLCIGAKLVFIAVGKGLTLYVNFPCFCVAWF